MLDVLWNYRSNIHILLDHFLEVITRAYSSRLFRNYHWHCGNKLGLVYINFYLKCLSQCVPFIAGIVHANQNI